MEWIHVEEVDHADFEDQYTLDATYGTLAPKDRGISWQCGWRSTILAAPWCSGAGVHAIWLLVLQQPEEFQGI